MQDLRAAESECEQLETGAPCCNMIRRLINARRVASKLNKRLASIQDNCNSFGMAMGVLIFTRIENQGESLDVMMRFLTHVHDRVEHIYQRGAEIWPPANMNFPISTTFDLHGI